MQEFCKIEKTINMMCHEIQKMDNSKSKWQSYSEEDLLYEIAICMFSSQMVFEIAVAIVDYLKMAGLLEIKKIMAQLELYENKLLTTLSNPIPIDLNGVPHQIRPRFNNRLAKMLTSTIVKLYREKISVYEILCFSNSAQHARKCLIEIISGFGPKQASLFLRRIGFCYELAILDRHILHYLQMKNVINSKSANLSNLMVYEKIEKEFQTLANESGVSVGCFDLAVWITIRVAKKERII